LKEVKIYISDSQNIFSNLALEEYLVTQNKEDILLFYINQDAVVIGKHQNPWREVDLNQIGDGINDRKLARRLSGGGTVFHDVGNINFSFIRNKEEDFVNFREHIEPISKALNCLGIENQISPRNDIFVNDHKVSGNAEHVNSKLGRILHHGTLLYDSDLIKLNGSIRPKTSLNIKTHAVDSVRSPVLNMRTVKNLGTTSDFFQLLIVELKNTLDTLSIGGITPEQIDAVNTLVKEKYISKEWTFGHTPAFTYTNDSGDEFKIRKGKVESSSTEKHIGLLFEEIL
jgi:lipoate-protein ligase A